MRLSSKTSASVSAPSWMQRKFPRLYAFWKFSRPHTIVGTSLSVLGVYGVASSGVGGLATPDLAAPGWLPLVLSLFACLCGNVYIVGLNQLEDVEIDRINKPHLPLASGEFSRRQGQWIVGVLGVLALAVSAWQGGWLMATVWLSLAIGTAYSLPPVRLKRFPFWASLCIFSVRGAIVNLGLFLYFRSLQLRPLPTGSPNWQVPAEMWALTVFILGFTLAIALFKDIPDGEGDRRYHISTFTLRLGARPVFDISRWVLTVCYIGMIVAAFCLPQVNRVFLAVTHGIVLAALWWRSRAVEVGDRGAIARCYQFIWKLFFLEYLLFPLACLMN